MQTSVNAIPNIRKEAMNEYGLYIDGQWTAAASGRTFQSISPASGEILATFAEGIGNDVEKAVQAAANARK